MIPNKYAVMRRGLSHKMPPLKQCHLSVDDDHLSDGGFAEDKCFGSRG
jgi:hypothetical protein